MTKWLTLAQQFPAIAIAIGIVAIGVCFAIMGMIDAVLHG